MNINSILFFLFSCQMKCTKIEHVATTLSTCRGDICTNRALILKILLLRISLSNFHSNKISVLPSDDEVDESKLFFFHGKLRVHIIAAQDLPDTDTAFFNIDSKDVTDPYVTGELGYAGIFRVRHLSIHKS